MPVMARTAGHIRKRQYQPSITSFLTDEKQRGVSALSPPLPEETQASLLTVGMRVRKSVPEGYKTHKTLGTAGLPFPSSAPQLARSDSQVSPSRELLPFCGLFKIGGLSAQEIPPPSSAPSVGRFGTAHDGSSSGLAVPVLSMSQSTLPSTQDSFSSSSSSSSSHDLPIRKRAYEDEAEAEMDAFFDETQVKDGLASQQPEPVRRMAKMKSSSRIPKSPHDAQAADDEDFEEAAFLAPMDVDLSNRQ